MELTFIALTHSIVIEVGGENEQFKNDFLMLFVAKGDIDEENQKISLQSHQINTPELKNKVEELIEKYKDINVKVFQLRSYFKKLDENEHFLIWPKPNLSFEERMQFHNYLQSQQEGVEYETLNSQFNELFGETADMYEIQAFDGSIKRIIGESYKKKRQCRFFNNNRQPTEFKTVAHAISESLGNKMIILNEECDACNSEFGSAKGIENSLITYLKFYSNFFGIRGKRGIPKIKGKNFKLVNEGKIELDFYSNDEDSEKDVDDEEMKFSLESYDDIVLQNIYKTLCKYFLSVIDAKHLPTFSNTIDWINGKIELDKLPRVGVLASYDFFNTHPSMLIYLRKEKNKELPYAVGEFHYTFLTFVFIIPLASENTKEFIKEDEYKVFWDFFKHFNRTKDWNFRDLSDNTLRKFTINLNFEKKK